MNMMEQIMDDMRNRRNGSPARQGEVPQVSCGCNGGSGQATAQSMIKVTRTPPELPQQTPQPGKNIMAEIMAGNRNRKIRK